MAIYYGGIDSLGPPGASGSKWNTFTAPGSPAAGANPTLRAQNAAADDWKRTDTQSTTYKSQHTMIRKQLFKRIYRFPYKPDVTTDPMQGHYIIFHIMDLETSGKLDADKMRQVNTDPVNGNYSLLLTNRTIVRTGCSIALYMPPQVSTSYGMKYADKEIGVAGHGIDVAAKAIAEAQSGPDFEAMGMKIPGVNTLRAGGSAGVDILKQLGMEKVLKGLDAALPGAGGWEAVKSGKIVTPHMELMFEGVGRREFTFSFIMIPKSEREAQEIEDIVKVLKFAMHPDYTTKTTLGAFLQPSGAVDYEPGSSEREVFKTRAMTFPNPFDIMYMHKGSENKHIHKISTCFLTKMDVNHGGDRYQAHADGMPQKTTINLSFTEIEIMTKSHIIAGH